MSSSITIEGGCRLQQNEKGQRGLVKKSRQRVRTILLECEWDGMGMASDQSSSRQFSMSVDQPGLEHPGLLILKIKMS